MGALLFLCISTFLVLFVVNNDVTLVLSSPIALTMMGVMLVADLYLLRSLLRDWTHPRE
jgi:hypothetical protein